MLSSFRRRAAQLCSDPVLRRWLIAVASGRTGLPAAAEPHRPPWLGTRAIGEGGVDAAAVAFADLRAPKPRTPITIALPGRAVPLAPESPGALFDLEFDDTEILLAVHRFAWLPIAGPDIDAGWVDALWRAWSERHGTVDRSWAWHPYTAAERVINIVDFARRHGLPGERRRTLDLLAAHGPAIFERLEYFGEHYTSNHLSNNGRGLFILGLALGIGQWADIGGRILLAEAGRIFAASGVLREGSSHYHLLVTRNYVAAWLAARAHRRKEADDLEMAARRAIAAIPHLVLPGGMPLIGDISPDCPPAFLSGLLPGGDTSTGWCALLDAAERAALAEMTAICGTVDPGLAAEDGWHRCGSGPWAALFHAAPQGWPPMPGHGHQDLGGFELHHDGRRVIVDPGRGAYGEDGEAARYASATVHSTVTVDGHEPYPPNRPYYDAAFRRRIGGPAPRVTRQHDGMTLAHDGFGRLGGVGTLTRSFAFTRNMVRIDDRIEGDSRRTIARRLHTVCRVERGGDDIVLHGGETAFRLRADGDVALIPATCWTAYGVGEPSTLIEISSTAGLPWRGALEIEAT